MKNQGNNRFHFIAIGGAAMHNLALALNNNGYFISGSDDEIMEPSLSRLKSSGLLPEKEGWYPEKITKDLDGVILGMHARAENPELLRAIEIGIPVYSFPEFLFEHSKNKQRVVIGGSHGKTSITSMILHVLKHENFDFDYMVGAKVEGFDTMVRLSNAPLIILEGDEYLSSPVDRRPKFHLYQATIGLISGIAWDHINVFPTYDEYFNPFKIFADAIPANGQFIYCDTDEEVHRLSEITVTKAKKIPYGIPQYEIRNGESFLITSSGKISLSIFGEHNMMNLEGARLVCNAIGVDDKRFYKSIGSFKGASRRLELIAKNNSVAVYRDFAHSPSKLKATVNAVRQQYPNRKLVACMELHTFSSLNEKFLDQYAGSMVEADIAIVYFNPHTVSHKKLQPITEEMILKSFANPNIRVFTDSVSMQKELSKISIDGSVFLLMSSGTFDGMNMQEFGMNITGGKPVAEQH